jgi:EAL domain-containing protein (putative c-di-GMP-specific phosphodiesterase class I)
MAEILKESLDEEYELCARNQGDRFILMLEVESKEHFLQRLQKLEEKLGNHIHEKFGVHMVIDMGVCFLEDKIRDIKSAIGMANQALEFLRDNSTSEIKVYDEQFEELLRDQHQKEELLESADIRRDFRVYYQEKVDIRSRKIVGAEALVRFVEPKKNVVYSPGFFIPYYEKTGQIRELDFFVLESVCQMLHRRMQLGEEVVPVSCNFSRRHFEEEDFPEKLDRVLEYYGIPRDLIEVEITETIVIEELQRQHLPETLRRLKEKGFRLSIDDFGAGYSSLGVFEQVPAAVIKLDRSFFINRTDRVRQVKIMQQIVSLADSLDAQVVCEGVENDRDIELMKEIGAYVAQGFYYAKPQPMDVFENKLSLQKTGRDA